ncbi:uncharacterized protein LOC144661526 [Oculina patagonica]
MADEKMTNTDPASGRSSSSKSLKSRQKTPAERISSASAYKGFTVNMDIQLSFFAGVVRLKEYYQKNPATFEDAIKQALERHEHGVVDPEVEEIICQNTTVRIKLLYRSDESLLSVKENYKESKLMVKKQLKEKAGVKEEFTMTIVNMEELNKKLNQIRLLQGRMEEIGMSKTHQDILSQQWTDITKDLETNKVLKALMTKCIFDGEDKMRIDQKTAAHDKNDKLLTILLGKDPDAFDDFVEILQGGTQSFIACKLLRAENEKYREEHKAFKSLLEEKDDSSRKILDQKWLLEDTLNLERGFLEEEIDRLKECIADFERTTAEKNTPLEHSSGSMQGCLQCCKLKQTNQTLVSDLEDERNQKKQQVEKLEIMQEACIRLQDEISEKFNAMMKITFQGDHRLNEDLCDLLANENIKLKKIAQEKENAMMKYASDLESERRKNQQLNNDSRKLQAECERLQKEVEQKNELMKRLASKVEIERKERDVLQTELDNGRSQNTKQSGEIKNLKEEVKRLQEDAENKYVSAVVYDDSRLQKVTAELQQKQQQVEELKLEFEIDCKKLQDEVKHKDEQIEKLTSELEEERKQTNIVREAEKGVKKTSVKKKRK